MNVVGLERRRTGWDVVLGILLVIGGFVLLGNSVFATAVSVLFLGWMALILGVVLIVAALFSIGRGGAWLPALGGALIGVLGLVILRNPAATAVTLTLIAGALFLTGGVARLAAAAVVPEARGILIFGGIVSAALGLVVLFNLWSASLTLLGVLLGIQVLVEGLAILLLGRIRPVVTA
jgi:uncharacterized membrane protein HdeD (DUF308 family)